MAEILQPDQLDQAVAALGDGELVAFPTETVYGLGADAAQPEAVKKIFEAKGRPVNHPLIVHIADGADLHRFGSEVSDSAQKLAEMFWPGPLTLIVKRFPLPGPAKRGKGIADEAVGGRSTVGLRVPDHPVALELLRRFGGGVAAPSANTFGGVSPTTAEHVIDDLDSSVAFVIDGGPSAIGVESTIVDVSGDTPVLLRPGGISVVELEGALGFPLVDGRTGPSRAPGMMASHYAPKATVKLVPDPATLASQVRSTLVAEPTQESVAAVGPGVTALLAEENSDGVVPLVDLQSWDLPSEAAGYAARLYATLREADRSGVQTLFIVPPSTGALLDAIVDRLQKAAGTKLEQDVRSPNAGSA